jgi:hypothetical protein
MGTLSVSLHHYLLGCMVEQHIDRLALRVPFGWRQSTRVDVHGCDDVGVAHEFLHYPYVLSGGFEQGRIGVPKGMPADKFRDLRPPRGRLQDLGAKTVRPDRELAEQGDAPQNPFVV